MKIENRWRKVTKQNIQNFKKMKTVIITLINFFWITLAWGQNKADKELNLFLQQTKPDAYVYIRTGHNTCPTDYEDTLKNKVDTVTIKLVAEKQHKQTIAVFSDLDEMKKQEINATRLFEYIKANISILKEKESYYRTQAQLKVQVPSLVIFPYETIVIKLPKFNFIHTMIEREMDDTGAYLKREKWFEKEVDILNMIEEIINTAFITDEK